jgi:hypothetical protein
MAKRKNEIPFWAKLGHGKPVTRRDFLSTGIIPFAAYAVGPAIGTLLIPREASAADLCGAGGGSSMIPFITVNLAGGPSLASQLVVKNVSGGNLKAYSRVGLGSGPNVSFNVEKEFGTVEFAGTAIGGTTQGYASKFLAGMRDPGSGTINTVARNNTALDKTAFVWSAVALNDDSAMNQLDITGLVLKLGLSGTKLPNLGRSDTSTGISQAAAMTPPPAPFVVNRVDDLANALGYSSSLAGLSIKQKGALAKVIANSSSSQIQRMRDQNGATTSAQLADCAGLRNIDLVKSGGGDVNPYSVPIGAQLAAIWGTTVADRTSQNAIFGAMVYNGISGNAATVNLNMGGYDYHDNTRTTGNGRDFAAGEVVGRILKTAELLGKPVFIYVCADGATVSEDSALTDGGWVSDRGIAGMQYMLSYSPAGRPATSGFQIGGFNEGQAADGAFPTGNDASLAAQAVFSNYAALHGRTDFLEANRVASDAGLRAQVIKFQKG